MRDEPLMPSTGHFLRVIQEYAGLGGDVEHLRQEIEAQVARSNDKGYVSSLLLRDHVASTADMVSVPFRADANASTAFTEYPNRLSLQASNLATCTR